MLQHHGETTDLGFTHLNILQVSEIPAGKRPPGQLVGNELMNSI
jgi:hypothetical protein